MTSPPTPLGQFEPNLDRRVLGWSFSRTRITKDGTMPIGVNNIWITTLVNILEDCKNYLLFWNSTIFFWTKEINNCNVEQLDFKIFEVWFICSFFYWAPQKLLCLIYSYRLVPFTVSEIWRGHWPQFLGFILIWYI